MDMDKLHEVQIKKVVGPTSTGTAVLLGNDEKTFVMYIGVYEGAAIVREINGERAVRPLTHELLTTICSGFDVEIKKIVIADIVDNTFCATLILEQKCVDETGDWNGKRNEVHIDARPSDCLVLSLKENKKIFVSDKVFSQVKDITEDSEFGAMPFGGSGSSMQKNVFGLKDIDFDLPDPDIFAEFSEDDD